MATIQVKLVPKSLFSFNISVVLLMNSVKSGKLDKSVVQEESVVINMTLSLMNKCLKI